MSYLDGVLAETAGTNLFEGPMPEAPDNCLHVAHYDSLEAADRVMSASLANQQAVWPAMVQVMARNTDKTQAEARARAAFDALDNLGPTTLGGVTYHSVEADGEPMSLGKDGNERWRYVFNVRVEKQRG